MTVKNQISDVHFSRPTQIDVVNRSSVKGFSQVGNEVIRLDIRDVQVG